MEEYELNRRHNRYIFGSILAKPAMRGRRLPMSLALAPKIPVTTTVEPFALGQANGALSRLRAGQITGAAVLPP